jgi:membrane protease YdiL (CAAX protease family)
MICTWGLLAGTLLLSLLYGFFPAWIDRFALHISSVVLLLVVMLPCVAALNTPCGRVFAPRFSFRSVDFSILYVIPMAFGGFYFFTGLNGILTVAAQKIGLGVLITDSAEAIFAAPTPFVTVLTLAAVFSGVIEESLFRGILMPAYAYKGKWKAIAVSALLFALLHGQPVAAPVQFAIGMLLGYIGWQTGSVIPCMLYHALHNGISLWQYHLAQNLMESGALDAIAESGLLESPAAMLGSMAMYTAMGALMLFVPLYFFAKATSGRINTRRLSTPAGNAELCGEARFTYLPLVIGIIGLIAYIGLGLYSMLAAL